MHRRELRLLVDFIPNHVALDHPWVDAHPEFLIAGDEDDLRREPKNYVALQTARGRRIFAHGRDPNFSGWNDTLQLNYRHGGLREAMLGELERIAERADGVRCDMAMLLEPEVIARTWGERAQPRDGTPPSTARSGPGPSRAFGSGTRSSSSSPKPTGTSSGRCRRRASTSPTTSGSTTACGRRRRDPCASTSRQRRRSAIERCTFWRITTSRGRPPSSPRRSTAPPPSYHFSSPGCAFFTKGNSRDARRTRRSTSGAAWRRNRMKRWRHSTRSCWPVCAARRPTKACGASAPAGPPGAATRPGTTSSPSPGRGTGLTGAPESCWPRSTTARRAPSATRSSPSATSSRVCLFSRTSSARALRARGPDPGA